MLTFCEIHRLSELDQTIVGMLNRNEISMWLALVSIKEQSETVLFAVQVFVRTKLVALFSH